MSLQPSFYSMYRRSRYARAEDDDEVIASKQNRKELFAVAAVAFALKHSEAFRIHFLRHVCGATGIEGEPEPRLEVQPYNHSDLAIKDERNSTLFIIEFKVGAPLEPKQNPEREEEFFGNDGYGRLISEEKDYQTFAQKAYIVVDHLNHFENGRRRGISFRSSIWAEFVPEDHAPVGLWSDLLDSLGELGITAFQFQKLKHMNNAQHTKEAVAMHQTLSAIASRLPSASIGGEDINFEGDEAWYGRNIPNKRSPGFLDLGNRVQTKGDSMGWFGYQSRPEHCERAVWFYCGSEEAAQATHNFILERVRSGPPGKAGIKATNVSFQLDGYASMGDAEWFEAVFDALSDTRSRKPQ